MLDSKVVKIDQKIIISLRLSISTAKKRQSKRIAKLYPFKNVKNCRKKMLVVDS